MGSQVCTAVDKTSKRDSKQPFGRPLSLISKPKVVAELSFFESDVVDHDRAVLDYALIARHTDLH